LFFHKNARSGCCPIIVVTTDEYERGGVSTKTGANAVAAAGLDYHVEVEKHCYSVPHQLLREKLWARNGDHSMSRLAASCSFQRSTTPLPRRARQRRPRETPA
jgi:hypothetical protein